MIRGIGILLYTHIFGSTAGPTENSDEYIFGKKLSKKIKYIKMLIGEK